MLLSRSVLFAACLIKILRIAEQKPGNEMQSIDGRRKLAFCSSLDRI